MRGYTVKLTDIQKQFESVKALSSASLALYPGEIHCIVGENGSGKTTLMHILTGYYRPDGGRLEISTTRTGMVYQHIHLSPDLAVWENIILGNEPVKKIGHLNRKRIIQNISTIGEKYGIQLPLEEKTAKVTANQRKLSQVLAALYPNPDLIIFDEPTATFTDVESERLFTILSELKDKGKTVVFITHKLREVFQSADRVTVLRKGSTVISMLTAKTDEKELSRFILGTEENRKNNNQNAKRPDSTENTIKHTQPGLKENSNKKNQNGALSHNTETVFRMDKISARKGPLSLNNVSLSVHRGEIVAVTGIRESGLELIEDVVSGTVPITEGSMYYKDKSITKHTPHQLRKLGIAYVPTDRMLRGAATASTVQENMLLLHYKQFSRGGIFKFQEVNSFITALKKRYRIHGRTDQPLSGLSGGNIQRVILSRELSVNPDLIIFAEPAWGLDIAGKKLVFQYIEELRKRGSGILIFSADMDEALKAADRIIVLYNGKIQMEKPAKSLSRWELGRYILGMAHG